MGLISNTYVHFKPSYLLLRMKNLPQSARSRYAEYCAERIIFFPQNICTFSFLLLNSWFKNKKKTFLKPKIVVRFFAVFSKISNRETNITLQKKTKQNVET